MIFEKIRFWALALGASSMLLSPVLAEAAPLLNRYSDYGVMEQSDNSGNTSAAVSISNDPFGYSGEYTDNESGLQYLKVRYYNPVLMRFIQQDDRNLNRYTYANDNSIMNVDPSGHNAVGSSTAGDVKNNHTELYVGLGLGLAGFIAPMIGGFVMAGSEGAELVIGALVDQSDEDLIDQSATQETLKESSGAVPGKDIRMQIKILNEDESANDLISPGKKYYRQVKIPLRPGIGATTPGGVLDRAVTNTLGDEYSLSHSIFLRVNEEGTQIIADPYAFQKDNFGFISSSHPLQFQWGNPTDGVIQINKDVLDGAVSGPGRILTEDEYSTITQRFRGEVKGGTVSYDMFGRNNGINCHMAIARMYNYLDSSTNNLSSMLTAH